MKMHHPRHPLNQQTQIPSYLVVQIQIENLVLFEFVPKNLSFSTLVDFRGAAVSVETVMVNLANRASSKGNRLFLME